MNSNSPLLIPLLAMIVGLLYRLNQNFTNNSSAKNQDSSPGQGHPTKFVGQEKRCGFCSVRMPLNSSGCLNCTDYQS
jgi:hypothetical protein